MFSQRINLLIKKLGFTDEELEDFKNIVYPIINHPEFQRRLTNEFLHHDEITTGEHIISVALVTYKQSLKKLAKNPNYDLKSAVLIALFHDLYVLPWQNNPETFEKTIYNKHGFRHPIEGIINSLTWFPEYYENKEQAKVIIDGIAHHMWPLPVRAYDGTDMKLRNKDLLDALDEKDKEMIKETLKRGKIGKVSLALAKSKEGKTVSMADKYVSWFADASLEGLKSCVIGHNSVIELKKKLNESPDTKLIAHTASITPNKSSLQELTGDDSFSEIEMDFHLTKDGVLVWNHGFKHNGSFISNSKYKEVKDLLTLDEVLEIIDLKKQLLIEIKGISKINPEISKRLYAALRSLFNTPVTTEIQSFNYNLIRHLLLLKKEYQLDNIDLGLIINLFKTFLYRNQKDEIINDLSFIALSNELFEWRGVGKDFALYEKLYPNLRTYAWSWDAVYRETPKRINNYLEKNADGLILSPKTLKTLKK